ncbi:transcriptional regulator, xre family [Bacillus sp. OxB-1]|uniref:helix-turn-helix domain-containing protein n=1 Tax=Bacillus sp. (strain OxB-1) TaxID=98228 RepID=UPI0005821484|nr:helix-turn-helix transcriptional regulator [Bacillus sp. OxB-1]BAQ11715.1 transcriptional regulator, xre family [Bacillus sp. OxB-1]
MKEWNKEDFGLRLKTLREQRGLSMMAFGSAIGTSASRIKDWEKGKNAPSAAWIAKISERFNVSTDELILGNNKTAKAFKSTGNTNVEMLYDKLRETIVEDKADDAPMDRSAELYAELDAVNKERYRSGKGRRFAERELLAIATELPKKEMLELLELAKLKKRWL